MDATHDKSDLIALVVEDSVVQRNHLVALAEELQFGTVLQACDGNDALRVLAQLGGKSIYLVITDIDMPGMDGIELIGRLAESRAVENVIVTSARDPRLLETVESMGADNAQLKLLGTVPKPVTSGALVRMLELAQKRVSSDGRPAQANLSLDEIEHALDAGQFIPFYQPKVWMHSGLLRGVEALARWQHPQLGMLGPQRFIATIEGTPLMARFTLSMVEQSVKQLQIWLRSNPKLTMSVNLSADDLADKGFLDRLMDLVNIHQVPPESLIWEVTETMIMSNQSLANLARLGLKGFGLSMDDYGIGYSSMQTLSRSPFTELKIDRIFVNGACERRNRRAILNSSLDMGRSLNIATVAEGVETVGDWNLLSELGCDIAQGYLIAKPMPAAELLGWVTGNRARLRKLAADAQSVKPPPLR
jgi:EAL domain-containing protein (putative c-di-GMP-specific phosphodiesterase class I)/FixJ family two-component response regulator